MGRFLLRRFISSIPVIIGILALVFALARMIPGDPCRAALGERATDEICDAYNERYGLNDPVIVQYMRWLARVFPIKIGSRDQIDLQVDLATGLEGVHRSGLQRMRYDIQFKRAAMEKSKRCFTGPNTRR